MTQEESYQLAEWDEENPTLQSILEGDEDDDMEEFESLPDDDEDKYKDEE